MSIHKYYNENRNWLRQGMFQDFDLSVRNLTFYAALAARLYPKQARVAVGLCAPYC